MEKSLLGYMAISRTSGYKIKPCEEAVEKSFIRKDMRHTDDPMKRKDIGKCWYDKGHNHRVENKCITRDLVVKIWVVHIPNAAALQAFVAKYEPVILSVNNDGTEPYGAIEIYDDFRE